MRRTFFATALALSAVASASLTTAAMARTIYECEFEEWSQNRGWLPTIVIVAQDQGVEEVQVSDPNIEYVHNGPISVKPKTDNDVRLAVSWKLMLESTQQNDFEWTYTFTVYKADRSAKITGTPRGSTKSLYAPGTCKVLKG